MRYPESLVVQKLVLKSEMIVVRPVIVASAHGVKLTCLCSLQFLDENLVTGTIPPAAGSVGELHVRCRPD